MSLLSPRFKSSSTLRNAANGVAIKQGARGRAVHLVQMALIDLGYPMPQSTGNPAYSPDGSFGNETRLKLIDYQTRNQLPKTGEIDKDTILKLDLQCRSYTHRVRLHFRSLALANVPFERSLQDAEIVFGQYGIKVEYASGQSLFLTPQEEAKFNSIGGSCDWEINTGEYNELHSMGSFVPSSEIAVYYVSAFDEANLLGCGGHAKDRPACTVAANASRWDTAHEVCHVLLTSAFNPVHVADTRNLMYEFSSSSKSPLVLTDRQVAQIKANPCCVRI
jgi:hypothetical protein